MKSSPAASCIATAARMASPMRRRYSSPVIGQSSAIRSLTNCGRGSEPMTEVGKSTPPIFDVLQVQMLRNPVLASVLEILLGIDLDIAAGGVDVTEWLAALDHVLK